MISYPQVQVCPFCDMSLTYDLADVAMSFVVWAEGPFSPGGACYEMFEDIEQFWGEHLVEHAEEMMAVTRT